MNENKIALSGIFENGYGIIPKKLMIMDIPNNVKLLLAYMLSYTGAGKECFPSYDTIAKHLKWSKSTVSKTLKYCIDNQFVVKKKLNNNPLNHANKYILVFLGSTTYSTVDSTPSVPPIVQQQYKNNNSINNNNINISSNNKDDINQLVNLYPTRCFIDNRSTNRSVFNRRKLTALIKKNGIETCKQIITAYLDDCKKTKTYVKNFATLINNFPSLDDFKTQTVEQPPIIYKENNYEELI
jgi:hypothetical protein